MGAQCSSRPTLSSSSRHCPHPQDAVVIPGPQKLRRTRASLCSRDAANRKLPNPHKKERSGNFSTGRQLGLLFVKRIPSYSWDYLCSAFMCLLPLSVICTQLVFVEHLLCVRPTVSRVSLQPRTGPGSHGTWVPRLAQPGQLCDVRRSLPLSAAASALQAGESPT